MVMFKGSRDNLPHLWLTPSGVLVDDRIDDGFVIGLVEVNKSAGFGGGKEILLLIEESNSYV